MSSDTPQFHINTYFRSSCSGRLRIALNLKSLSYKCSYTNLLKDEQTSASHLSLNPSGSVPVLTPLKTDNAWPITQSVAGLEYLEEAFPDRRPLLPPGDKLVARAQVRTLVNIIACDTQPVTNRHIMLAVGKLGKNGPEWSREYMTRGLKAYEETAKRTAGEFSVGDEITMADVVLVPAVWGAERFGVDLEKLPTVKRIYETMSREEAVVKAHWRRQEDTPEEFRESLDGHVTGDP